MDIVQSFARQITYDAWANQELFGFLTGCDLAPKRAWSLFDHILGTSATWMARLGDREPELAIWPELGTDDRPAQLTAQARAWKEYVDELSEGELDRRLSYLNSKGTEFETTSWDVLHHVLAHAHYHRGQVASALGHVGVAPPWTDPLVWTRLTGGL